MLDIVHIEVFIETIVLIVTVSIYLHDGSLIRDANSSCVDDTLIFVKVHNLLVVQIVTDEEGLCLACFDAIL